MRITDNMQGRDMSFGPICSLLLLLSMATASPQSSEYIHPIEDHTNFPLIPPISTPGLCVYSGDCPLSSFCKFQGSFGNNTCIPRRSVNSSCTATSECRPGLICTSFDNTDILRCQLFNQSRFNQPGGPCDETCIKPFQCSVDGTKCIPIQPVRGGERCNFQNPCMGDEGYFCSNTNNRCIHLKQEGQACDNNDATCEGFCAGISSSSNLGGICLSSRKPQAICTSSNQCGPPVQTKEGPDDYFCNLTDGPEKTGLCEKRSSILKTLGAKCFRRRDLCDRSRDLRCRYSRHLRRNACQHDPSVQADKFDNYCDPNSKLSRCARTPFNEGRECRSYRIVPGRASNAKEPPLYPRCLRKRELVGVGQSCEQEFAMCPPGAECRVIPGIRYSTTLHYFGVNGQFRGGTYVIPDLAVYCVNLRDEGEGCGDKFKTVCKDGLRCEAGKCVKGEKALPSKNSHAHVRTFCEDIPCTPGHACLPIARGGRKVCVLPVMIMKRGQPCEPAALFDRKCAPGLICMSNRNNISPRKCRPPNPAGGYCEDNSWCKPGLKCPKVFVFERNRRNSRCYNKTGALGLGKPCNPRAGWRGKRCSFTEMRHFVRDPVMTRCLPKGRGFACQIDAGPFGRCGTKLNRACGDERFTCSPLGVCILKNEA